MPTSEAPANVNEPQETPESTQQTRPEPEGSPANGTRPGRRDEGTRIVSTSRWIDYDTHELLDMISALEDERRWARLREGVLWAVIVHGLLILTLFLLPRYVFQPKVIDTATVHEPKEWTYLDSPAIPRSRPQPPAVKPLVKPPVIDKKTLDDLRKQSEQAPAPPTPQPQQAAPQPKAQVAPPLPPSPQSQSPIEAPRPAAVPARPNFAMQSQNPADQLQQAMRNAMRGHGQGVNPGGGGRLPMHPGAGAGGAQILTDTQGVDFNSWLRAWYFETERTWDPLIPDEVNPPISKQGQVMIRFKVQPNGRLIDGSVILEGRSGDTALDRAAWGALTGSNYPPLPRDFHGPYIELRAWFLYNMRPPQ